MKTQAILSSPPEETFVFRIFIARLCRYLHHHTDDFDDAYFCRSQNLGLLLTVGKTIPLSALPSRVCRQPPMRMLPSLAAPLEDPHCLRCPLRVDPEETRTEKPGPRKVVALFGRTLINWEETFKEVIVAFQCFVF